MASFKNTNVKIFSKLGHEVTPENIYWRKLGEPVLLKEFGPIDYIDFSLKEPYHFAVTCSVRVQLYNPITKVVFKNINRFQETAYGGKFRDDGKLLCAGGDEAQVKLFDVGSKNLLRVFSGHSGPVHRCFFTTDSTRIMSCSDDKSVMMWDMPSEKHVARFEEHKDYVRAGAVSPASGDIVISGGYDNHVKMYDVRTGASVLSVDHRAPVESLLFMPTGGIFLSAGGNEVCVWDAFAGGKLIARMSQHHKTITCLALASEGKRILSGSLDRHVKVYDAATYETVHSMDYPSAILSLGISPGDESLAVGMVDGLVSLSRRVEEEPLLPRVRGKWNQPARPIMKKVDVSEFNPDVYVMEEKEAGLSNTDRYLRSFRYSKALDSALAPYNQKRRPDIIVGLLQELIRRKGLAGALAGRDEKNLVYILRFIMRYIGEFKFSLPLIDTVNTLLDVYSDELGNMPDVAQQCKKLKDKIKSEEKLTESLLELQGALLMMQAAASIGKPTSSHTVDLEPSDIAQSKFILNVT